MQLRTSTLALVLSFLIITCGFSANRDIETDLLIVGGTESGCAEAIQAARMGISGNGLCFLQLMGEFDDDELGRPDRGYADFYDHPPFENVLCGHRCSQAHVDEVCAFRSRTGQRALFPETVQKNLDHAFDFQPGGGIVAFEHSEGRCFLHGLLDHVEQSTDVDIAPLIVVAGQRPRTPDQGPLADEAADGVDGFAGPRVDVQHFLVRLRDSPRR